MSAYFAGVPILSVVVPDIKTDSFEWSCSDAYPARQSLVFWGLVPVLSTSAVRATDEESTQETVKFALEYAKAKGLCSVGSSVVVLHRISADSVIKVVTVT